MHIRYQDVVILDSIGWNINKELYHLDEEEIWNYSTNLDLNEGLQHYCLGEERDYPVILNSN